MTRPRTSPEAGDAAGQAPGGLFDRPPRGDVESAARSVFAPQLETPEGGLFWRSWIRTLRLLRPLGHVSKGNGIEVLADGDRAFEAMWEAISQATRSVLLNTYILEADDVGLRTSQELCRAAEKGCRVIAILDAFGSSALTTEFKKPMREAGVTLIESNPLWSFRAPLLRLVRNHRKILVVDGEVAFCGGMNISEDYAGERYGNARFRDTHLRLMGPCVRDLAQFVLALAREIQHRAPPTPPAPPEREGGALVQVLESNIRRQKRAIQKALRYTIHRAVRRCYLTSPYFVPPARFMRFLQRAARRGVDVRVLTAGRSDVPLVNMASQHLYGQLLRAGVRIFEMQERTLHAKTATIDGVYGAVGSFNLDFWSYRRNLEVTVSFLDPVVAEQLEDRFRADLELSCEVVLDKWSKRTRLQRILHWMAYQIMRI